jgi:protein ImuB
MFLRLQIENFRLFAALRIQGRRPDGAVVLVDADGRVAELDQAAQGRALTPGMTMARVLSRCSGITVLHADLAAERAAKRLLWNVAWQLTPQIELGEGSLEGCATLELLRPNFEKLTAQVPPLLNRLRRSGLPARAGLAATPVWAGFAAATAERFGLKILPTQQRVHELLAHLPLAALDTLSPAACRILEGWGIRSLAGLAALPRQDLGERLGPNGLQAWDVLNGTAQPVLRFSELEMDYRESFDLEEPVQDLPSLRFLMQQACEALALQLEQTGKMARALAVDLWLESGQAHQKTIRLPEATRRADLMERLLGNYLEQTALSAPVVKGRVAIDPVDPLARQAGLFERSVRNPWRLQETLDQLAGLVGSESFGAPRLLDTHHPDAYQLVPLPSDPASDHSADKAPSSVLSAAGPPFDKLEARHYVNTPSSPTRMGPPLRRFRPPLPAKVWLKQNHPAHLECSLVSGPVHDFHGPYALNGDWAEARPWAQWEWDIEIESSGVFCLRRADKQWHLVGAYD